MPRHLKVLVVIFLLAAGLRFIGLNWDQNAHLHPDERFLTMVANSMRWPKTILEYLDTSSSPLNPHNIGYDFYVYGTFPVIFVKFIAEFLGKGDYNQLTLVGRTLSALFDLGTLLLIYLIAQKIFKKPIISLIAALCYAASVLPIQLSHFFAVDPYLTFFLTLSFYLLLRNNPFLGIAFGLAIASKISAVLFAPVIALGFLFSRPKLLSLLLFIITLYFTVRLAQPYLFSGAFSLNPQVLANWQQLKTFDIPGYFPPAYTWVGTYPYIFPLENLLFWGLGLPLGTLSIVAIFYLCFTKPPPLIWLAIFWTGTLFLYQGAQFAKPLRYFYPIYPFLAIFAGAFINNLFKHFGLKKQLIILIPTIALIWPMSFISIYLNSNTRVTATKWVYDNIPKGSRISCEHWDDCVPIGGSGPYQFIEFPMYNPDTSEKWSMMQGKLSQTDYLILSSNRIYGTTMNVPQTYPATNQFYKSLFNGSLGFTPVAQFTSRPNIPIPGLRLCLTPLGISYGQIAKSIQDCPQPGISFVDDYADETLTVYDHPKVIIFKKNTNSL